MLLLARHVGQIIMIGDNILVKVIEVKGHEVKLGIEAPREIDVHRLEVYERIKREQQAHHPPVAAA